MDFQSEWRKVIFNWLSPCGLSLCFRRAMVWPDMVDGQKVGSGFLQEAGMTERDVVYSK